MDDLKTLLEQLSQQAINDACAIDPAFKEKVEQDRKEWEEHDKMLEAQRTAKPKEQPKNEWTALWQQMRTPKS